MRKRFGTRQAPFATAFKLKLGSADTEHIRILWDWCLSAVPRCSSHSNKWAERSARNTAICLKFRTKQKEWKNPQSSFYLSSTKHYQALPPRMSCINSGEAMRSVTAWRHFFVSLLLCQSPALGWAETKWCWISAKSQPSSCTYPLHHSSAKTLTYRQACKMLWPKSLTQQIRCPLKFLSLQSPAKEKCLCSHTSPRSCASSTCTHLLIFLFSLFSLPNCN